jgi:hypothetical protein
MYEEALRRAAGLPRVLNAACNGIAHCDFHIRVVKNYVRVVAAKLEEDVFQSLGPSLSHSYADLGASGEAHRVHQRAACQKIADHPSAPRHELKHVARHAA